MTTLIAVRSCAWCGKEFAPLKNRWAQFCCKSCANSKSRAAKRDRLRAQPKICKVCGGDFIASRQGGQTICSRECRLVLQSKRNRQWLVDPSKREIRRAHWQKRTIARRICPQRRLVANMRSRLHYAVDGRAKAETTMALVGCDRTKLVSWLEAAFLPEMTWENYGRGGWHVDHIVPCAAFDLLDPEQQRQCFHYTNLQPLWEADNCAKGARLDWDKAAA